MNGDDRRSGHDRRDDEIPLSIVRLETLIETAVDDIKDVKDSAADGIKLLDQRVRFLEDVRVRALEDWRTAQGVLERERERVRDQQARASIGHREFWLGVAAICATVAVSFIGHLF
jgi:hypothetical protein